MAFDDTLFQLGMDLTRSSTAQKEDHSCSEHVSVEAERAPATASLDDRTAGNSTLFIDLHGTTLPRDTTAAKTAIKHALQRLGCKLKSVFVDPLQDGGLTGVAVLAQGHVSLATCPRTGKVAVDARGFSGVSPCDAMMAFAEAFGAREAVIQKVRVAANAAVALAQRESHPSLLLPVGSRERAIARAA